MFKKWKKIIIFVMIACMLVGTVSSAATKRKVKSLYFTNVSSKHTLKKGEKKKLKYYISKNATYKKVKFKSSRKSVVSVSSKGTIKAKKRGTATITITARDGSKKKDTVKVTVGTKVSSIKRTRLPSKMTLTKNHYYTAKASVSPRYASNKSIKWTTSNSKVATVSSKGRITAKGNGTATIKAKATDGTGKYKSCKVTVVTKISSLSIKNPRAKVALGDSYDYNINFKPSTVSNKILTWKSSNTSVATVSSKGVVTGKKEGTATISATAKDGSKKKTSFTVRIQKLLSNTSGVKFIAHRGLSSSEPENTQPAFQRAAAYKFYGIENDVWESSKPREIEVPTKPETGDDEVIDSKNESEDDQPKTEKKTIFDVMVMHDSTTGRMCAKNDFIRNVNKENRNNYYVTKGNNNRYSGLVIPTLDEYLDCVGNKAPIIEIKEENMAYHTEDTQDVKNGVKTVIDTLREKKIQNAMIITFHHSSLESFAKARKLEEKKEDGVTFKIMYLKSATSEKGETISEAIQYCRQWGVDVLGCNQNIITSSVVSSAHQYGLEVGAYTVDDKSDALYYADMGVDYITTNKKLFDD